MPNLRLEPKMTIGKIKIYQEASTGKHYIKIGKGRTRSLFRSKKRK